MIAEAFDAVVQMLRLLYTSLRLDWEIGGPEYFVLLIYWQSALVLLWFDDFRLRERLQRPPLVAISLFLLMPVEALLLLAGPKPPQ